MALMFAKGELTPMPDAAIFADTGAEPQYVYDWLDWLEKILFFVVLAGMAGKSIHFRYKLDIIFILFYDVSQYHHSLEV